MTPQQTGVLVKLQSEAVAAQHALNAAVSMAIAGFGMDQAEVIEVDAVKSVLVIDEPDAN